MAKTVDCFMFFNELDLLEGRLAYLYESVDYFVLVESNLTQSGQNKPMHFAQNMVRYQQYLDKVLYFPLFSHRSDFDYNKMPTWERDYDSGPWQQENAQRNHISKALSLFNDHDIVMISDLDEIPHKDCIQIARNCFANGWDRLAVEQGYYAYNFRQRHKNPWIGTAIALNQVVKSKTPQGIRNERHGFEKITNGGWHLTYWGNIESIQYKIETFAHQELNQEKFRDPAHIREKILKGIDMFDRNNEFVKIDPDQEIPLDILELLLPIEKQNMQSI